MIREPLRRRLASTASATWCAGLVAAAREVDETMILPVSAGPSSQRTRLNPMKTFALFNHSLAL